MEACERHQSPPVEQPVPIVKVPIVNLDALEKMKIFAPIWNRTTTLGLFISCCNHYLMSIGPCTL